MQHPILDAQESNAHVRHSTHSGRQLRVKSPHRSLLNCQNVVLPAKKWKEIEENGRKWLVFTHDTVSISLFVRVPTYFFPSLCLHLNVSFSLATITTSTSATLSLIVSVCAPLRLLVYLPVASPVPVPMSVSMSFSLCPCVSILMLEPYSCPCPCPCPCACLCPFPFPCPFVPVSMLMLDPCHCPCPCPYSNKAFLWGVSSLRDVPCYEPESLIPSQTKASTMMFNSLGRIPETHAQARLDISEKRTQLNIALSQ